MHSPFPSNLNLLSPKTTSRFFFIPRIIAARYAEPEDDHKMATQKQIQANRANGAKSKGPVTPEGKKIALRNLALPGILSGTIVLKGESMRRYNDLAASLILQFQPRNPAEVLLVHVMTSASWRLLRIWGIQTADFQREMARQDPAAGSKAVLAAITFRNLAENSRALALQHRVEAIYDRQYNRALTTLLKLRQMPDPSLDSEVYPPIQLSTETWDDDFSPEPNSEAPSESGSGL
jgi:hypothetical protein